MTDSETRLPPPGPSRQPTAPLPEASLLAGTLGDYRIVRTLGEGGMGIVYEAEQQHPRRAVALKVIRGAQFVDDNRVRMFQREAQTLARLKHPGIAAIYESGRTEDGQHFFAMELVRGETLQVYLRRRAAGEVDGGAAGQAEGGRLLDAEIRFRLALFRKICEAVNYAHQRGVIHRDLKPSNILVARESGAAVPRASTSPGIPDIKILDFGLARITDTDAALSTIITHLGQVQGTLAYMSPEQVRGATDEVDLRSDVYSLGVLLFEMLSGQLPYDTGRASLPEVVQVICETRPPSLTRVWSGARKPDSDVETIVLKALEKEPARRYQSALVLAEDVQRYLTSQPILARPPSAWYQIRKLVSRHRVAFAFAASLVVLLAGFAATMAVQAGRIARARDRANQEAETARQTADFLVGIFEVADPGEARGNSITAREILDRGADKIEAKLQDQPLTQARMMETMGKVYTGLGLYHEATPLLMKTVEVRSRELGEAHADTIRAMHALGVSHLSGDYAEARRIMERAVAISRRTHGPDHLETAWGLYWLSVILGSAGDPEGAALREVAQRVFEKELGPDDLAIAWCLNDRALEMMSPPDPEKARIAVLLMRRAHRIKELRLGPDHPDTVGGLNSLGWILVLAQAYEEAKPLLTRAVALNEKILGPNHPVLAYTALHSMGELLRRAGEFDEARSILDRALAILEPPDRPPHPEAGVILTSLAELYRDIGRPDEAATYYRRTLESLERNPIRNQVIPFDALLDHFADVLRDLGRVDESARMAERAREVRSGGATEADPPGSPAL